MPKSAFARLSVGLLAFWIVLFAFVPQVMVLAASLLSKGSDRFIAFEGTLANYARLADPIYLGIFADSFRLALITTLLCLIVGTAGWLGLR